MKVLIIDPDLELVEMLESWLLTQGYEIYRAYTSERARLEWERHKPDLVLVDPAVNDANALAMCHDLRNKHDALVLVMTHSKEIEDEVRCLESGADDYVRKPLFPSQLLAHIKALSRRGRSPIAQRHNATVTVGPIRIDSLRNIASIDSKTIHLTPIESKLLHLLAINANQVCSIHQIVTHIWGSRAKHDANLIKPHIWHLRQKIEPDPSNPSYVLTVPRVGYTLIRHSTARNTSNAKELARTLSVVSF